jgi:hypothetical protein
MIAKANDRQLTTRNPLPDNLPAGAKAFQAAVDGKLTREVWAQIIDAQIAKAKEGDRGAAKFLLEYAGGVASMRGATFVQENHQHDHYHELPDAAVRSAPRLTGSTTVPGEPADRSPADYERARERKARRIASAAA